MERVTGEIREVLEIKVSEGGRGQQKYEHDLFVVAVHTSYGLRQYIFHIFAAKLPDHPVQYIRAHYKHDDRKSYSFWNLELFPKSQKMDKSKGQKSMKIRNFITYVKRRGSTYQCRQGLYLEMSTGALPSNVESDFI